MAEAGCGQARDMRALASVAETRAADQSASARLGEGGLIDRAGHGVGGVCARLLGSARGGVYGARVVILAGSGHNAADAFVAGQLMRRRGASVVVVRASDRDGDALWSAALRGLPVVAPAARGPVELGTAERRGVDLVLDGLTGLGGRRGGLTDGAAALAIWAEARRARGAVVVSVDLPSGVDADTGSVTGPAVRADVTVTFDRLKPAHVAGRGADWCGQVVVVPAGLSYPEPSVLGVLDADDVRLLMPTPGPAADKYSRGVVGVVAGGDSYTGAAVLCTGGAVRGGAGYVRYAGPSVDGPAAAAVRAAWPSVVVGGGRVDAYVCGPGLGSSASVRAAIHEVLDSEAAAVLDAGALDVGASALRGRRAPTLITPHAGEFERLTGVDPASDPLGAARSAAADLGVHVLLKGQRTVIAAPDGRALVNPTGSTWLSTAGTGDVLAGAAGALLAAAVKRASRGTAAFSAAEPGAGGKAAGPAVGHDGGRNGGLDGDALDVLWVGAGAAFLHGLAGRYAPVPLNAADLLTAWQRAVAAVRND